MGYVVKMPKLGLEMEEGTILEWHVEEGDSVEEGEVIAEVESEKSISEVDAREDGVLRLINLEEGTTVPPGTPIGIVAGADEDIADLETEFDTDEESTEAIETEVDENDTTKASSGSADGKAAADEDISRTESTDVKASPKAEQRADELGVDLTAVDGTGPQGAITADDVEATEDTEAETETATEQVRASPRAERRATELGVDLTSVDGSGPQGAITADDIEYTAEAPSEEPTPKEGASGTTETKRGIETSEEWYRTTTLVTHGNEADTLIETTEMAANAFDFDVSTTDVLLLALSAALDQHPTFNATFENNTHHLHEHQDIALVDDAEEERVESVVSAVGERTFIDLIEASRKQIDSVDIDSVDNASKGRTTFALANGNEYDDVRNVVTPPTVAGLVADCSHQRAIPAENGVTLRRYLTLSLAYDSRAVGDSDANAFLETLLERIEEVSELVLQTYR
jgi:pyruvate/2-oxoglutarate dehydrogenase complex dihydrolipoamide acyltransferase (E2) component